ncbi:hypothetical protein BDW59DRAFT_166158 [Aspergillus cavernicola]|uniref:Uncharacterized protein n=1 Tax=Aspergillus cavernicola TaxID=176166 RepID=A0ABR4HNH6_9EURO
MPLKAFTTDHVEISAEDIRPRVFQPYVVQQSNVPKEPSFAAAFAVVDENGIITETIDLLNGDIVGAKPCIQSTPQHGPESFFQLRFEIRYRRVNSERIVDDVAHVDVLTLYVTAQDLSPMLAAMNECFERDRKTVLGYASIFEHELHRVQVENLEARIMQIRVLSILRAVTRRYIGFLNPSVDAVGLYPGDPTVIPPIPATPPGFVTVLLTRRWDRGSGEFRTLDSELVHVDVHTVNDTITASQAISAAVQRDVMVKFLDSSLPFSRSISALRFMTDQQGSRQQFLLTNSLLDQPLKYIYEGISGLEGRQIEANESVDTYRKVEKEESQDGFILEMRGYGLYMAEANELLKED